MPSETYTIDNTGEELNTILKSAANGKFNTLEADFALHIDYTNNPNPHHITAAGLGIGNLLDGSATNSIRQKGSEVEGVSYTIGANASALGSSTKASGTASHAEGNAAIAQGDYSHAEGNATITWGEASHAEGTSANASGNYSHAEGNSTTAWGSSAHAEGSDTFAEGNNSHAEGSGTTAGGVNSHAEGVGTVAGNNAHVQGKYNIEDNSNIYAHIVGNGADVEHPSNAHTLDWSGNAWFAGEVTVGLNKDRLAKMSDISTVYRIMGSYSTTYISTFVSPVVGDVYNISNVDSSSGIIVKETEYSIADLTVTETLVDFVTSSYAFSGTYAADIKDDLIIGSKIVCNNGDYFFITKIESGVVYGNSSGDNLSNEPVTHVYIIPPITVNVGDNIVWTLEGFDRLAGEIDLSAYSTTAQMNVAIEGAISEHNTNAEAHLTEFANYYTKSDVDAEISAAITGGYNFKGAATVTTLNALSDPTSVANGDIYNISVGGNLKKDPFDQSTTTFPVAVGDNVAWTSSGWIELNSAVDLTTLDVVMALDFDNPQISDFQKMTGYINSSGNYTNSTAWKTVVIPCNKGLKKIEGAFGSATTTHLGIAFYSADRMDADHLISGEAIGTSGTQISATVPSNAVIAVVTTRPASYANYYANLYFNIDTTTYEAADFKKHLIYELGINEWKLTRGYYNSVNNQIITPVSTTVVTDKIPTYGAKTLSVKCEGYGVWFWKFNGFYGTPAAAFVQTNECTGWLHGDISDATFFVVEIFKPKPSGSSSRPTLTDADIDDIKSKLAITVNYKFYDEVMDNQGDIVGANKDRDQILSNFVWTKNVPGGSAIANANKKLCLLHFSDIHTDGTNLSRAMQYYNAHSDIIDNILFTGDYVLEKYASGCMDFWTAVDGAENILGVIGNHDASNTTDHYGTGVSQADLISMFFYNIANWGVTQDTGKTWWYKDYTTQQIRMIGINTSLDSTNATAQLTWLESVLADAQTNSYSVIIASHFPVSGTKKPSSFTALDFTPGHTIDQSIIDAVDAFIDNGGEFICYLSGHTHYDYITAANSTHPQVGIAVTTAKNEMGGYYGDQARKAGTRSNDAFNLVSIDPIGKVVKLIRIGANYDYYIRPRNILAFNYITGEFIDDFDALVNAHNVSPTCHQDMRADIDIALRNTTIANWTDVQTIVRSGKAKELFQIGDQFEVNRGTDTLVFDVIDIDHDTPTDNNYTHSLTLQLHNAWSDSLYFDSPEAAFYIDETAYPTGLAAGTYHFWWNTNTGSITSGSYEFTLTSDIPAGGQIVIGTNSNTVALTSCKISTYATAGGTTAIESNVAIASGDGGTSLGKLYERLMSDKDEHNYVDNPTELGPITNNSTQRILWGSNNWASSGLRQWLNASGAADAWWEAKSIFDRPTHANKAGFLNGMDADFLAVLGTVSKTTQKSYTDGFGLDSTTEKVFLPSIAEVYGGTERAADGPDGTVYDYYGPDYSSLSAAGIGADSNRIKYKGASATDWWLRTADARNSQNNGHREKDVAANGSISQYNAYFPNATKGVVPVCVIV